MNEILLNFKQVASQAAISRHTLYKWEQSGRFNVKPFDDRKPRRWHIDDVRAWLAPKTQSEPDQLPLIRG